MDDNINKSNKHSVLAYQVSFNEIQRLYYIINYIIKDIMVVIKPQLLKTTNDET